MYFGSSFIRGAVTSNTIVDLTATFTRTKATPDLI